MCTAPLPARRVNGQIEFLGRSEKERFFFGKRERLGSVLQIPCGQCAECRLKRSREWAVRCMHEASLHPENCFLTLTYESTEIGNREGLKPDRVQRELSLHYADFSGFMKRLRAKYSGKSIRFFCCGEYGETNPKTRIKDGGKYRAHFHAILFNHNFADRVPCRLLDQAELFKSKEADKLWGFGAVRIGEVTFESAAYVARYAMKKVTGDLAESVYTLVTEDGEMISRRPEMLVMSKRPAIGREWFERFGKHAVHWDRVIARGEEMQMPRYYDKLLPEVVRGMLVQKREVEGSRHKADHTDARNAVRDVVVRGGLDQFKRD